MFVKSVGFHKGRSGGTDSCCEEDEVLNEGEPSSI